MSRTLSPCVSLPVSGSYIELPFPNLAKPVPGGWSVSVGLRATTANAGKATISVRQGGRVIASKTVTPTTSFATYSLPVSEDDLNKVTTGLCHVGGPVVIITGTVVAECCPGVDIPTTLTISLIDQKNCECCTTTATLTYDASAVAWINSSISVGSCGTTLGVKLYCDVSAGNEWRMDLSGCNGTTNVVMTVTCDPFEATSIYSGDMRGCCDNTLPECNIAIVITA